MRFVCLAVHVSCSFRLIIVFLLRHESYGRVPSYLLKRKEEMLTKQQQDTERLSDHPTDCPEGMRLMQVIIVVG